MIICVSFWLRFVQAASDYTMLIVVQQEAIIHVISNISFDIVMYSKGVSIWKAEFELWMHVIKSKAL